MPLESDRDDSSPSKPTFLRSLLARLSKADNPFRYFNSSPQVRRVRIRLTAPRVVRCGPSVRNLGRRVAARQPPPNSFSAWRTQFEEAMRGYQPPNRQGNWRCELNPLRRNQQLHERCPNLFCCRSHTKFHETGVDMARPCAEPPLYHFMRTPRWSRRANDPPGA